MSDVWMFESSPLALGKKVPALEKALGGGDFVFTLLTGLRAFGRDPSGDSCFVSTLPERHQISNIFQRIREKNVRGDDVIAAARDVLVELYRWSRDEHAAVSAAEHGAASADAFGELLELPHIAEDDRTFLAVVQRLSGQEAVVRAWLATALLDDVTKEIAKPRRAFRSFVDLLAARAMVLGGRAEVERAITSALEERLAVANDSSGNDLMLLQLAYVAANIAASRKLIAARQASEATSYYIREPLARALSLPKLELAHDFDARPIALTLQLGMDGYSEDSRPTNHFTLTVRDKAVAWESSGAGYTLGTYGVFDGTDSRGAFRVTGEIACASHEAAKARATEELRAMLLLGYGEAKSAKKK